MNTVTNNTGEPERVLSFRTPGSEHVTGLFRAQRVAGQSTEAAICEVYKIGAYNGGARGLTPLQSEVALAIYGAAKREGLRIGEALDEVFLSGYTAARAGAFIS